MSLGPIKNSHISDEKADGPHPGTENWQLSVQLGSTAEMTVTRPFWSLSLRKHAPEIGHAGKHLFADH